ncbi:TfoX/Sxy family protein [Reyranella sp.]|uniref:TfoX/Sxy family protein n=1 Tax=Reyranella sp. TaxID=1929291 RepID=UPI003D0C1FAE
MPYDIRAADGLRVLLSDRHDVVERKMMGGLVFMVGGNMCVVVSGRGGLMVRVGADAQARVLKEPHVKPMTMAGRPMTGFVRIAPEGYRTAAALHKWLKRGLDYVETLPAKAPKRRPARTAR